MQLQAAPLFSVAGWSDLDGQINVVQLLDLTKFFFIFKSVVVL